MNYPSGLTLTYAYTDINALSSVTDGTNSIASFTYVGFRPKVTTFGNSTTTSYSYAGFREDRTTIHHETSTPTTLVRLDYGYNKLHDRTFERYGTSGSAGDAFEYDKARRLTKAWMGSSTPSSPSGNAYVNTIAYNMDDDGNRTSVVTTPYGVSPTTESYTTNTLNQYTAVGGTGSTYDANGNLSDDGAHKFKYDYRNLICEVRLSPNNNLVSTYKFDATGRRVGKAVSGGVTERYISVGVETIVVYDSVNGWRREYIFDLTGVDEVLALNQADILDLDSDLNTSELVRTFYHRGVLGSVMDISDPSQTSVVSVRYSPYGAASMTRGGVPLQTDPLGQDWTFTSRCHDTDVALGFFRARSLSYGKGRFLSRDPMSLRNGGNLYTYAANAPTQLVDPLGLSPCPVRANDSIVPTGLGAFQECPKSETPDECKQCCDDAAEAAAAAVATWLSDEVAALNKAYEGSIEEKFKAKVESMKEISDRMKDSDDPKIAFLGVIGESLASNYEEYIQSDPTFAAYAKKAVAIARAKSAADALIANALEACRGRCGSGCYKMMRDRLRELDAERR